MPLTSGFGLLENGIGGGAASFETPWPANSALFTGGGGGFFFPRDPTSNPSFICPPVVLSLNSICGLADSGDCVFEIPPYAPTLSAIPYLVLNLFADCHPDLTCSPCLSRKLFAVLAAVLASLNETDDGSFRKEDAVFSAACF